MPLPDHLHHEASVPRGASWSSLFFGTRVTAGGPSECFYLCVCVLFLCYSIFQGLVTDLLVLWLVHLTWWSSKRADAVSVIPWYPQSGHLCACGGYWTCARWETEEMSEGRKESRKTERQGKEANVIGMSCHLHICQKDSWLMLLNRNF